MTARLQLAWIGIAGLAVYLLFFGGAWLGLYLTELRIFTVAAAGVVLLAWSVAALRSPCWRPRSVLMPAILASLASLAISTVASRFPRVSLEYLGYAIVLAALYLLLVRLLASEFFRTRIVALASVLFVVVVVAYVNLVVRHWLDWWSAVGFIAMPPLRPEYESLTYGTPSTVLTVAAMLAVPTIANVLRATRIGVALAVVMVLLVGVIALLTGSRAGWLALALAGSVGVLLGLLNPAGRHRVEAYLRHTSFIERVGVTFLSIALLSGALAFGPTIARRAAAGGEENRIVFVRIALELFSQSPVLGTGPGSWVIERLPLTQPDEPDEYIPHAHNVYAQTLGELGIGGAAAGLLLAALLLRLCWRSIRSDDPTRRTWGWLTLIALLYFAAHQLLDFYPNMPAVLFTAAIPVAFLDALELDSQSRSAAGRTPGTVPRLVKLGGAVAVALAIGGLLVQEIPATRHDQAVDKANDGDWQGALAPATEAAREDPAISPYLFTAGLAAAWNGDHTAAAQDFHFVAERDDFPEAWLNAAAEQAQLGLRDQTLTSIHAALRLGRQRPAISMPAGDLALRLGNSELAVEAFSEALAWAPSLAGDSWWTADQARSQLWPAVLERAQSIIGPAGQWELALMLGDVQVATARARATADPAYSLQVTKAWMGDANVLGNLLDACDADPGGLDHLIWCARLADHAGRLDAGSRYRYIANVQAPSIYRAAHELRVDLNPPKAFPILEGGASIAWGTYTYRRVTAWDVLVSGLIRLRFQ